MKKVVKFIIIGLVIALVGVAILIGGLAVNGWRLKSNIRFETRTYTAESQSTVLKLDLNAGSVVTQFYDGDKVIIEYPYANEYVTTIYERSGQITLNNKIKWYATFGISLDIPKTYIKLPSDVVFDVTMDIDSGEAELSDGTYGKISASLDAGTFKAGNIECTGFECDLDAGSVNITSLKCNAFECDLDAGTVKVTTLYSDTIECNLDAGTVKFEYATSRNTRIDVDAGTVNIGFTSPKQEYTVSSRVRAGRCNVGAQTGTTDKKIVVELDAGTVNLTFAD